jgi:hypothetical protein
MRSTLLCGVFCGLFYLGILIPAIAAPCGCDGSGGGGGYNWWSIQGNSCGEECGGDCGYPYRRSFARSCDPCADSCRPMTCHDKTYCGPLTPLFALFTRDSWCGTGCGERYWGDFYGDPPDYCDPCDRCGNYTGGSSGCSCGGGRAYNYAGPNIAQQRMPTQGQVVYKNDRVMTKSDRVIAKNDRMMGQVPTPASKQRKTTQQY